MKANETGKHRKAEFLAVVEARNCKQTNKKMKAKDRGKHGKVEFLAVVEARNCKKKKTKS